jgi:multiple sugar transport system substrate-binding protein
MPLSPRATLALLSLLTLTITGCGIAASDRGPVEIRYWTGWTGEELETQKRLVEEFNRTRTDFRVRVLSVGGSYQKVRIAFAGAATPDVVSAVWADELAGYALRGVLTPLDDQLRESGRSAEEWVPGVQRMLTYEGKTYGLAVTTNTSFIVFNKRIFREVGLNPDRPPQTIAELDEAAERCTTVGPGGRFVRYGLRPQDLNRWAYVFGGSWYDPVKREITADHPGNIAALRWMASYGRKYDVTRMQSFEAGFGNFSTPNGPFFVGKVAMWQTGEWSRTHIRRHAPDLDWGWFPVTAPPGGRRNVTTAGGSVFVIPAATKYPKQAWTFLEWLTRPYAVGRFCGSISNLPPLKALSTSETFRKEPVFAFALDLAAGENVFGPPPVPVWPRYKQEIIRAEDYGVFAQQDPERLLRDLDRRMEEDLARTLRDVGL